jgi:hypothetical protein
MAAIHSSIRLASAPTKPLARQHTVWSGVTGEVLPNSDHFGQAGRLAVENALGFIHSPLTPIGSRMLRQVHVTFEGEQPC